MRKRTSKSETTRVPQSVYLREALDDLLKKYASTLRRAKREGMQLSFRHGC
jgi:hypothetical protein